mgnify:CR=1 FL=1
MKTGENQGGALSTDSGAESSVQNQDTQNKDTNEAKPNEGLERALKDVHKYKSATKQLEAERNELRNQLKAQEEKKLEEQNEYKALAELRAKELVAERDRRNKLEQTIWQNERYKAVQVEALKAGLRPEAEEDLNLLSLDAVVVEGTTEGRLLVNGAKDFVDELKKTRSHWFKAPGLPAVNTGKTGFSTQSSNYSASDVGRLETAYRKKPTPENKEAFQNALAKYVKTKTGRP